MSTIVHKITVDILRGIDQKSTKWGQWASIYTGKPDLFAFWDTESSVQLGRVDLRELVKRRDSGIGKGERPGQLPSSDFSALTFTDTGKGDSLVFDPDQAAVLKIIRTSSTGGLKTTEGIRVIGDQTQDYEIESPEAPKSIVGVDLEGVEVLFETNTFLLQNINESFQEKFQIAETFGEPVLFLFDKRQQIFQYGGVLLDSQNWQWKEKFLDNYERHLRGTRAVKNNAIAILTTSTAIVRGYILNTGIVQNDQTRGYVGFNFSMFVVDRIPLDEIERSPQDQLAAEKEEEDPQAVIVRINDQSVRPGTPIKTLERSDATVQIEGITPGLTQWSPMSVGFNVAFRPTGKVNGVDPKVLKFGSDALPRNPPDLRFTDTSDVPPKYLTEVMESELGQIQDKRRIDLESLSTDPVPVVLASFGIEDARRFPSNSIRVLYHRIDPPDLPGHNLSQIEKMKALFSQKKLKMEFGVDDSFIPGHKIDAFRTFKEFNGQLPYRSTEAGRPVGGVPASLAFEIEISPPILAGDIPVPEFTKNDVVAVRIFEADTFVKEEPPDLNFSPALYHVIPFAGDVIARRVGDGDGVRQNTGDFHVLVDPSGEFQTDLQEDFDNEEREIFVVLPYDVKDEDEEASLPSAKVKVREIVSQTELKLGLLTRAVKNKTAAIRQPVGKIDLDTYKIIVVSTVKEGILDEDEIRKRVLNPPTGAFNNVNTGDPLFAKLVQPQGAFQLKKNTHFTKK